MWLQVLNHFLRLLADDCKLLSASPVLARRKGIFGTFSISFVEPGCRRMIPTNALYSWTISFNLSARLFFSKFVALRQSTTVGTILVRLHQIFVNELKRIDRHRYLP